MIKTFSINKINIAFYAYAGNLEFNSDAGISETPSLEKKPETKPEIDTITIILNIAAIFLTLVIIPLQNYAKITESGASSPSLKAIFSMSSYNKSVGIDMSKKGKHLTFALLNLCFYSMVLILIWNKNPKIIYKILLFLYISINLIVLMCFFVFYSSHFKENELTKDDVKAELSIFWTKSILKFLSMIMILSSAFFYTISVENSTKFKNILLCVNAAVVLLIMAVLYRWSSAKSIDEKEHFNLE